MLRPMEARSPRGSSLPDDPAGWYCVAFSSEIDPGGVLARTLAGRELVLFRTRAGRLVALDAHCPHQGAHLGHGGAVEGECIRCPFHGFRFDAQGVCTQTGYATRPPPRAKSRVWPLVERHGVVMVYWHPDGCAPAWEIPDLDTGGWTPLRTHTFTFASHVQEVAENAVDVGHFRWVHGYEDLREIRPLRVEGPLLTVAYGMSRPRRTFAVMKTARAEFEIHQHGLGYARVEVWLPDYHMRTRQFVLARPLGGGQVELAIAISLKHLEAPRRIHPALAFLPRVWLTERIADAAIAEYARDVGQDVPLWRHKRYLDRPALAEGDGPVGAFRRWARQFYEPLTPTAVTSPEEVTS